MVRFIKLLLASLVVLVQCSCTMERMEKDIAPRKEPVPSDVPEEEALPLLSEGLYKYDESVFGPVIELWGINHPLEPIFTVQEAQLQASDGTLVIKNINGTNNFMAFTLQNLDYIQSFGPVGRGPGELANSSLITGVSEGMLCTFYDFRGKILHYTKNFELVDPGITLDFERRLYDHNMICAAGDRVYYYVGVAQVAKEIYRYTAGDSVPEKTIKKLSINGFKGWAPYTGYLGANIPKNRLVFAYKYFKQLVFTDLSGKVEHIIQFDTEEKTKKQSNVSLLGPESITYYWGLSAQKESVYLLYSGRSPLEVIEEKGQGKSYIFVEEFDWNGKPLRKYRLDRWGYFCVDDREENIYLLSTDEEQPLFQFVLPASTP